MSYRWFLNRLTSESTPLGVYRAKIIDGVPKTQERWDKTKNKWITSDKVTEFLYLGSDWLEEVPEEFAVSFLPDDAVT